MIINSKHTKLEKISILENNLLLLMRQNQATMANPKYVEIKIALQKLRK